jgi:drug/metabolite transporter (DMT)-like permease
LPKTRAYLAWVVVCLVWGTTYLGIRIAIESIPPLLMAGVRWVMAGTLLVCFFRFRGDRLPPRAAGRSLVIRGVLLVSLGNGAVVWAEQTVPSGLTSILVALAPFWMVGVESLVGETQSLKGRQFVGLSIGFCGVMMLIWPQLRADFNVRGFLIGLLCTQLACAGWALGSTYARRRARLQREEPTITAPAFEMLSGGVVLLAASALAGERLAEPVSWRSIGAVAYLIVFGSIVAFSAYRYALQHLSVAAVSQYVYVNTVIAMALGTVVLAEPLNWQMAAGAAVVLTGIALVKGYDG